MPVNKPIPVSLINYWEKVYKDYKSKFSAPEKVK